MGLPGRQNVPTLHTVEKSQNVEHIVHVDCAPYATFAKSARPPLKLSARSGAGQRDLLGSQKLVTLRQHPLSRQKFAAQLDIIDDIIEIQSDFKAVI